MNKLMVILLASLPLIGFSQADTTDSIPTSLHELVTAGRTYNNGDTIANLKTLNIGLQSFQISKESSDTAKTYGVEITDGAAIILKDFSKLTRSFQFFVKTKASDEEFYENTIDIKVKDKDILLVNVTTDKIEMATGFRKEGKIYVVIAVSMILFFTIIAYLIYLERKTKKLEKQLSGK